MKNQTRKLTGVAVVAVALMCISSPQASAQTMWEKLQRGFVNMVSGCVEIPGCIYDVAKKDGGLAGATWGTTKGVGMGPLRTMVGIIDLITFPIPANDYQPILEPVTPYDYFSDQDRPKESKPSTRYVPPAATDTPLLSMGPGPLNYAPIPQ